MSTTNPQTNQTHDPSTNQSIDHLPIDLKSIASQCINQAFSRNSVSQHSPNQSIKQSIHPPIHQSINHCISRSSIQSPTQPIKHIAASYPL
jgi:hypothetical protein